MAGNVIVLRFKQSHQLSHPSSEKSPESELIVLQINT